MTLLLDMTNDDRAPARARAWLANNCDKLENSVRVRAELGLVEAVNNAVAYRSENTPGRIRVRLYRSSTLWVFQVRDANRSAASAVTDAIPDPAQTGGRGWYIIRQVTTEARYHRYSDHNVVTLALLTGQQAPSESAAHPSN